MKEVIKKAVASARYFKNKKETDMWHCIWHDGKPYDYHLILDNYGENEELSYEVDIYEVLPVTPDLFDKEKIEWGGLNDLVHLHTHTLPYNPNLFEKGELVWF